MDRTLAVTDSARGERAATRRADRRAGAFALIGPPVGVTVIVLLAAASPARAFRNNGFETEWVYGLKTADSALIALRESDGATMATLVPAMDLSDPAQVPWITLTFSGTAANNDARLFVGQSFPKQVPQVQDSTNVRIAELDASGNMIRSVTLSSMLPGSPSTVGPNTRLGNLRYSRYHGTLFVVVDKDYRDDTSFTYVYELDLALTKILNTYVAPVNTHHDESNIDINFDTGTIYICEPNLGQPPRSQMTENGQGDLVAIETTSGSTSVYRTLIDGPTYAAGDSRWLNPGCPIYRGMHNPSGRPTLVMLLHGPTVSPWQQLEFFLDATDGVYPPAGNLALRGSLFTSQRFAWRGQLDEVSSTVMAARLNQNAGTPGIDLIAPDDSARLIGTGIGWQDADSPGVGTNVPAVAAAAMPQIDTQDHRRFTMDGQPWYPAGYYPGLGAISIRGPGETREAYYTELIDRLSAGGVNYFRTTFCMGQALNWGVSVQTLPYAVTGTRTLVDGANTYVIPIVDCDQFNTAHFDFWHGLIEYARSKGVVVQLCIVDSWHNNQFRRTNDDHAWGQRFDFYAPDNNVNGLALTTENEWHSIDTNSPAWPRHTAMMREVVDRLGDLPNIVWEVCNEPRPYYDGADPPESGKTPNDWTMRMGNYLKSYELSRWGYNHVCMPVDLPDHQHTAGQKPPDHTPTATHASMVLQTTTMSPLAPLIADNDAPLSDLDANGRRQKAWATLTAGGHIDYFHYEMGSLAVLQSSDAADGMRYVGYLNRFLDDQNVVLRGMVPSDSIVSNGWCYARTGEEYVIYLITGGSTNVSGLPTLYFATWFNPRSGGRHDAGFGPVFTAPDAGDWVLHIVKDPESDLYVRSDYDRDGDVDLTDFAVMQRCFSAPEIPVQPGCENADLDADTDVDASDLATFLGCLSGAGRPPSCLPM